MTSPIRTSTRPAPPFIQQLRDARVAAGLTQIELAAHMRWGVDRLRAYEDAHRAIHPRLVNDWAQALGRTITTEPSDAHCRVCHCTENDPCEGGCAWVVDGSLAIALCTACAWAIARDAIASGLYQLQATDGDTVFEARGGLIPQPMLTEAEIDALQPLIAEVEAARGDVGRLDEIAERERSKAIAALGDDMGQLMEHVAVPVHVIAGNPPSPTQRELDETAARVTAFLDERSTRAGRPYKNPNITSWHGLVLLEPDLRALLAERARLTKEVEQLQVELGYALAPDDEDEPLTLRDVDPDAVYATEDDDFYEERAEAYGSDRGEDL